MEKKTIVYLNLDCYTDTDMTVLHHLAKEYRVVWYYIHEEIKAVHRITIAQAQDYAKRNGIEIKVVDPKLRYRDFRNFFFYRSLAKEINAIMPTLIYHCHRDPFWNVAIKMYIKCHTIVLGIHDAKVHTYAFSISRFLETATKDFSLKVHKNFVTFSPNQHDLFLSTYGKESQMVGMSCKDFGASTLFVSPVADGVKLLFFGSINEYKGLDLLIQNIEDLYAKGITNLSLTIAGCGESWDKCKALIKTESLYNVQVRFIDNAEIPDLMSSHHFLVLPYRDATQSGPLVTAVAYQLPVIAPAFGCFTETYNDKAAILYPQGSLEEALRKAAGLKQNEYDSMKLACKAIKEANSEETVAANYIKYFNSLIE